MTLSSTRRGCNCSSPGAEGNSCDIRTGQCRCRPHVVGRACDRCQEGYWGLSSEGCKRCVCGAGAAACDEHSGVCACAPGVGGARCDACLPGYYGFGPAGCLPCPSCGEGKVCEPGSGRCVCPARSRGAGCRSCAPGHWRAPDGCRPCDCGPGAISATCEPHNGQCSCRAGWAGRACDACAVGHHGPRCRPCACHAPGTRLCNHTELCPCDDSGQCDCKDNVEGEKCDVCRAGTFGLSAENPVGCTACFCFGRSAHCTQAGLTRAAVHAAFPRTIVLHHHQASIRHHEHLDVNSLLSLPSETIEVSLPAPPAPVYMELDKRFLGDRVTSYGGLLQFTVQEEGGEDLLEDIMIHYPLVRLHAAHSIVLDFFQRDPPINGTHYVRFHESLWRARAHGSEATASRAALMVALSDLKQILVRVTTRTPMYGHHVHARLLNVSLDTAIPGGGRSATALGVELCACPSRYAASSCQRPAVGFWQPPVRVNVHHVAGTIVIDLEGDAQPCYCSGRARTCDPITGHCLNCTEGTGGARCEVCAPGYHGAPEAGCQACPCPERARNFATSCVFNDGRLQCLCKPGYAGTECESCAAGWWRTEDGACAECACDPRGALTAHCDHLGRCRCRDYATGVKCDQCKARRTFFGEEGCQQCDSCSQTLLDGVEELTRVLNTEANVESLSKIPKPYPALQQFHENYTTLSMTLEMARETTHSAKKLKRILDALENKFQELKDFSDIMKSKSSKQNDKAQSLSLETMSCLEQILSEKAKIAAKVAELDDFARGERHMSAHRALKEARRLQHAIRQTGLIDRISAANDIFDLANLQSTAVKELNYRVDDALGRAGSLLQALDRWHLKISDLNNLTAEVWKISDPIMVSAQKTKPRLSLLKDTHLKTRLVLETWTGSGIGIENGTGNRIDGQDRGRRERSKN
ncbi:Laminin subunit alpha-1 [Eumeta japonica]|uniref:Laminin subunit alpha-1 n=1 Tax=Eumeta variegata TaxID=151549 RepID=A0A4C1X385_EUMVA|nr:Laminin subunit alpha-1 [Eumeta japonica]